ncbi:hypothetical protein ACVRXS_00045 [Streptococcus orisratti]|uniref:hypothetical protein n=1 Tax=Streptococcus orisratti TaxID=114652 RepID=UPI00035ED676|nr:hypothetical protein [Streptococcus orisratti]
MIDRSYLPFQSAREYQDVGMQKWMGFFLSEHTAALSDDASRRTYQSELTMEMKHLLLGQLYVNQLTARITVKEKNNLNYVIGNVLTLTSDHVLVKSTDGHITIALEDMLAIELLEEAPLHESA